MGDLSAHVSTHEFRCRCLACRDKTGPVHVSPDLIQVLEAIRDYAGFPLVIASGYRCKDHNAAMGGADDSAHLRGEAADIKIVSSHQRFKIIEAAMLAGVSRMGFGSKFLHVDVSVRLPQEIFWDY